MIQVGSWEAKGHEDSRIQAGVLTLRPRVLQHLLLA